MTWLTGPLLGFLAFAWCVWLLSCLVRLVRDTDRWDLTPTGMHVAEAVALANGESAASQGDIDTVRRWLRAEVIAEEAHKAAQTLDAEWREWQGSAS